MLRYCDYCGYSYLEYICQDCGKVFETCACENGVLCEECADREVEEWNEHDNFSRSK